MTKQSQRIAKQVRCAIYCRKSHEDGLEQEFNSLDAQRESGEAYIKSQQSEGWFCLPDKYDDGGYSGGSLERPALKRLMAQIEAGQIDCVVVYKVDRLSRSLLDFARIMEVFERRGVSFVSVTQQFNTASSMGRLILNVLLSFAQFEREMISERTRDKIAAARRKGKWAGGMPLLGYDVVNRKLVVNELEANQVREMFKLYRKHKALLPVVREIARRGWKTKSWTTQKGRKIGGQLIAKSKLYSILRNPTYSGKVRYKQESHQGEHAPIVSQTLFDEVQTILEGNGAQRVHFKDVEHPPLLRGLLRCKPCETAMVHAFTSRGARRYRYYHCNAAQMRGYDVCPAPNAPAPELERFVLERIWGLADDPELPRLLADSDPSENESIDCEGVQRALRRFSGAWVSWSPREQAERLGRLVRVIQYDGRAGSIEVALKAEGIHELLEVSLEAPAQ